MLTKRAVSRGMLATATGVVQQEQLLHVDDDDSSRPDVHMMMAFVVALIGSTVVMVVALMLCAGKNKKKKPQEPDNPAPPNKQSIRSVDGAQQLRGSAAQQQHPPQHSQRSNRGKKEPDPRFLVVEDDAARKITKRKKDDDPSNSNSNSSSNNKTITEESAYMQPNPDAAQPGTYISGAGDQVSPVSSEPFYETAEAQVMSKDKVSNEGGGGGGDIPDYVTSQLLRQNEILSKLRVPRNTIKLGEKLGQGVSGAVYKATMRGVLDVAVKKLLDYNTVSVKEFLQEAAIMGSFSDPEPHPNIVAIIGVCDQDKPNLLLMEYMEYGDLAHYLYKKRVKEHKSVEQIGVPFLLEMAEHVANAMSYLEKLQCVHRDLAARNVLLSSKMTAKITDFGLSREVHRELYYEQKSARQLPVRWMAYETLTVGKSSIKSDVWSYGVFVWELFTLAESPYPELGGGREIVEYLDRGGRLKQPPGCPASMFAVMMDCWEATARDRPSFGALLARIVKLRTGQDHVVPDVYETSSPVASKNDTLPPIPRGTKQPGLGVNNSDAPYVEASIAPTSSSSSPPTSPNAFAPRVGNLRAAHSPPTTPDGSNTRQSQRSNAGDAKRMMPQAQEQTVEDDDKDPYWMKRDLSRPESEEILEQWGAMKGYFVIRESGPAWVMSRVGMSDEGLDIVVHRKILYQRGRYQLQSTRTEVKDFSSLFDLVAFYQENSFSDGTRLTKEIPPPVQKALATKKKRYVNVTEGGNPELGAKPSNNPVGEDGKLHSYVNVHKKGYVNVNLEESQKAEQKKAVAL